MMAIERHPTVRHAVDPAQGIEFLVEVWADNDWRLHTRPIGADSWTQWSPPVDLIEVPPFDEREPRGYVAPVVGGAS